MTPSTIIDTGPLVAAFDAKDQYNELTTKLFAEITLPLITCEAVIIETCFILSRYPDALQRLGNWLHLDRLLAPFQLSVESRKVFNLMKKYEDLPMSLADACLVTLAEKIPQSQVFTFDQHFNIYRTSTRRTIRTIGLEK